MYLLKSPGVSETMPAKCSTPTAARVPAHIAHAAHTAYALHIQPYPNLWTYPLSLARSPTRYVQDDFLDSVHAQNMEAHRDALAEVGIDTADIPAPDLCLVGVYLGEVGEENGLSIPSEFRLKDDVAV